MISEGEVSDTLNLPGVRTKKHVYIDGQHSYLAEGENPAPDGPCCLLFAEKAVKNGTVGRKFVDTTRDGKPSLIHYDLQKWRCRACGATKQEHLAWAEPGHGFTIKAANAVFDKAIRLSFSSVANEFGVQAKTVADIFTDRAKPAVAEIRRRTPRVLGLDEKYLWRVNLGPGVSRPHHLVGHQPHFPENRFMAISTARPSAASIPVDAPPPPAKLSTIRPFMPAPHAAGRA